MLLQIHPDVTVWPKEAIQPKKFGYSEVQLFGDLTHLGRLQPMETCVWIGNNTKIHSLTLNNYLPFSVSYSEFSNIGFAGQVDLRANRCTFLRCTWDNAQTTAMRIRQGASYNRIYNCTIKRKLPFATTADVIGIYFSDGPNIDNWIHGCTIFDVTDAIQLGVRVNPDGSSQQYGHAAGTLIQNCKLGFTDSVRVGLNNAEGCENCIDLKTGGTKENPVTIRDNVLIGTRPNSRTPGYAINYKDCASNLNILNNVFANCTSAIFNNIQYVNRLQSLGVFNPSVTVEGNILAATPKLLVGIGVVDEKGTVVA